jgi:hypothetical protein
MELSKDVTCPALYHYTAKKTESACELVTSAAGSNIYTLSKEEEEIYKNHITKLRKVNGPNIVAILNNYFVFYLLTRTNIFNLKLHLTFTFNN